MTKCGICDSELSNDVLTIKNVPAHTFNITSETVDLHIAECDTCHAAQLVDVPFSSDYTVVYRSISSLKEHRSNKKEELRQFIERYDLKNKKFLEFGCGDGQYLDILQELGIKSDGIEFGTANRVICKSKGHNIKSEHENNYYDVIMSFFVLEHWPNPKDIVEGFIRSLKSGGILYLEVPNYDYIKNNNLWLEFTRDHRFYYNESSINYLLDKSGFRHNLIKKDDLTLKVVAFKDNKFKDMRNTIQNEIDKFNKLTSEMIDYVIVGAGHYTQLLLNQIDIKPKAVYDTVPAKIGNVLHGCKIQSQEYIKDCPYKNIIISCGAYNQEAKKNIEALVKDKNIVVWG